MTGMLPTGFEPPLLRRWASSPSEPVIICLHKMVRSASYKLASNMPLHALFHRQKIRHMK